MAEGKDSAVQARQALYKRISTGSLELINTEQCQLLPTRELLLEKFPKGAVIAEIGVASGSFSESIARICCPRELHLIDLWEGDRYSGGLEKVRTRLNTEISNGTVIIKQGFSTKVLESYPDEYFDVMYIDTNHSYDLTLEELMVCKNKIKPHGLISGHDFCVGNVVAPYVYGVIQACCKFAKSEKWAFRYLTMEPHGHWSFALTKI